jgi:hypothetical protein
VKQEIANQEGRAIMSEDTQVSTDNNASVEASESSRPSTPGDDKQSQEKKGSGESDKASAPEDAKQHHRGNNSTGPDKVSEPEDAEKPRQNQAQEQASTYTLKMDSAYNPIVGDNPHVTINYYADVIQGKKINFSKDGDDTGTLDSKSNNIGELISKILWLERRGTAYFPERESKVDSAKLPETEEEFSEWYYGLSDYEQCYVQVAAVLHGASAHEVSKRADILYKRLTEHIAMLEASLPLGPQSLNGQETQQRGTTRFSDTFLRKLPGRELRVNTHTITQPIEGVKRLYWQDIDSHGLSTFGLHLLDFLSSEFISRGEHGQISLEVLENWSKESSDEVSWKAARSYGVVLWCHNTDLLGSIAEEWAKVDSLRSRRRTAELLDGAFEIERLKTGASGNEKPSSIVLSLMNSWIDRVHTEFGKATLRANRATINLGCTVASAYGWIGKRSPEIALDGLERLLKLPQSRSTNETNSIFAAGVSTYVTLIWSGHVRYVLERLASDADRLSHQRDLPSKVEERQQYRRQREVRLNAILQAFFLIAVESFVESRDNHTTSYSLTDPFPANPAIPDPGGRDVLMAGIFSAGDVRKNIKILLCAAIVEQQSRLAFWLLRIWAEVVLEAAGTQDKEVSGIYLSFQQFIVELGKTVDKWCLDLEKQGFRSPQAIDAFKNRLERWTIESRYRSNSIVPFAQEVLKQLDN